MTIEVTEEGIKLALAVGREILEWTIQAGRWITKEGRSTGLKVAKELKDRPELGFFRPDVSYVHVNYALTRIHSIFKVRNQFQWRGHAFYSWFVYGDTEYEACDVLRINKHKSNEVTATAALLLWRSEIHQHGKTRY